MSNKSIIDELYNSSSTNNDNLKKLLLMKDVDDINYLYYKARELTNIIFSNKIYIRGLIEISNYCKNDCYYCGIRCSNDKIKRYKLTNEEILECCKYGYNLGFRTFVLQSGETNNINDIYSLVQLIHNNYSDCAITLSIGELSYDEYYLLYKAGATRYLLRHETANEEHYRILHPNNLNLNKRKQCLNIIKDIGYQVGTGMMVGTPHQTLDNLIEDLNYLDQYHPHMVGIGPFLPASNTPFELASSGSLELTLKLIAIIRLMHPDALIPATTALATLSKEGRKLGILAGANVVMPNLSPIEIRNNYALYNDKANMNSEAAEGLELLKIELAEIGYEIDYQRGDYKRRKQNV
ncbi:MAG: [FeFe] hydrogenase H-cluster radical SAM maturase HydE [Erysipelotrichaceae bacterium]